MEDNTPASTPIDLNVVRSFCDLAETHNLARLEVSYKSFSLGLSRVVAGARVLQSPEFVTSGADGTAPATSTAPPAPPPLPPNVTAVRSPLAGVFYRAIRPGAPPFITEGDTVRVGQTLCIIEAMKLMNEIAAETHARVYKILVENAQVVEAGQEIILLETL